jgi:hypothetical protein
MKASDLLDELFEGVTVADLAREAAPEFTGIARPADS